MKANHRARVMSFWVRFAPLSRSSTLARATPKSGRSRRMDGVAAPGTLLPIGTANGNVRVRRNGSS